MILDYAAVVALWLSIIVYAALGGADFGGGIWYLFTFGKRKDDQKSLIGGAIGPVWEANNVWIIFLIVGLYTTFPTVSAVLATSLFIPFTLVLIGIVLRGAAFAFESHISEALAARVIWGQLFSTASIIAPFFFGTSAAAVASGQIHVVHGNIPVALFSVWLTPFAIVVGLLALAICSSLAAVYLTVEAQRRQDEELERSFRTRAFIALGAIAIVGAVAFILAPSEANILWNGLVHQAFWAVIVTVLIGVATAGALFFKRYKIARILIILEIGAILGTWGLAQNPYLIPPDITLTNAASPPLTMQEFLISAAVGMSILIPSMWFLFHVFKGANTQPRVHEKKVEEA
ncbi:MAG: cytochrome d ubiquinol oxidase subunit II [Ktedonobacteraceae bacterium]